MSTLGTEVKIDLSAIIKNHKLLTNYVDDDVSVIPIIKNDAYGLGAKEVIAALGKSGVSEVWIADISDAIYAKKVAKINRVCVLYEEYRNIKSCIKYNNLDVIINREEDFSDWAFDRRRSNAHIWIDLGSNFHGLKINEHLLSTLRKLNDNVISIIGHISGYNVGLELTAHEEFVILQNLQKIFPSKRFGISASDGIFLGRSYHMNFVRSASFIFGFPITHKTPIQQNPVSSLKARVSTVVEIKKGDRVGYVSGAKPFTAKKNMKIAIAAVGYGNGLRWSQDARVRAKISGFEVSSISEPSMEFCAFDISDLPNQKIDHGQLKVTLFDSIETLNRFCSSAGMATLEVANILRQSQRRSYAE